MWSLWAFTATSDRRYLARTSSSARHPLCSPLSRRWSARTATAPHSSTSAAGYGVRYVDTDPHLDVETKVAQVAQAVRAGCDALGIAMPEIHMEPGRSIVGAAGMTLYTVGSVKRIPGYKNYVSVDGGMADNPRFALYRSQYTCLPADRMEETRELEMSLVGRCCESGDIIQEHVPFPAAVPARRPRRGVHHGRV